MFNFDVMLHCQDKYHVSYQKVESIILLVWQQDNL